MTDRPRCVSLPRDRRVGWTPRPPVPPGCIDVERHRDRWVAIVPVDGDRVRYVDLADLEKTTTGVV